MSESITVYSPDGVAERHSRANARDLVNGAAYTWHPNRPTTPAAIAPFAVFKAPEGSKSQEVLNRATGQSSDGKGSATSAAEAALAQQLAQQQAALAAENAALEAAAAPSDVVDYSTPPVVDDAEFAALEAAAEAEAEAATADIAVTPSRRGRGRAS